MHAQSLYRCVHVVLACPMKGGSACLRLSSYNKENAAACSLQSIMSKVNKKEEEILQQKGIKVGDRVSTKFRSGAVPAIVPALSRLTGLLLLKIGHAGVREGKVESIARTASEHKHPPKAMPLSKFINTPCLGHTEVTLGGTGDLQGREVWQKCCAQSQHAHEGGGHCTARGGG